MEIFLTILGGLACLTFMCAAAMMAPRLLKRSPLVRRGIARLRSQTPIDRIVSWVEEEEPDLRRASAPDGTVTILFSDIENSSRLNERHGDQRWLELLSAHNTIVRAQVDEHGGHEVKSQGDGFMVAFPTARRAVLCAIDIQRALHRRAARGEFPIRVRIGMHSGAAIHQQGDFFGRSVVLAARIADHAEGGEILISSPVQQLVAPREDMRIQDAGEAEFKGLDGQHRLFRVAWTPPDPTSGLPDRSETADPRERR
jgi:class 3 adenylate cyclase